MIGRDDALTNAYRESYTPQTPPTPESDNDLLIGGKGDDRLFGGKGRDVLKGGGDSDRMFGGDGADRLLGGNGSDFLVGNQGNDTLLGGAGNDTLRYVFSQNRGASDQYSGNGGVDTLQLEFTEAQWARVEVKQDILAFARFMAAHTDSETGQADSATFQFSSFDLAARSFEKVRVKVGGTVTPILTAKDDHFIVQEDSPVVVLGSVLDNDFGAERVEVISDPAEGTLALDAETGDSTFDTSTGFANLGAGEARDVSFNYRIFAADGSFKDATATITVQGVDDDPIGVEDRGGRGNLDSRDKWIFRARAA